MLSATSLQDYFMNVGPGLDVSEIISLGEDEILGEFNLFSFVVLDKQALRNNGCRVKDSGQSSTK